DKVIVGYCVRVHEEPPPRFKEIAEVLDDEPLLTEDLLRLTRWMADYYLCGWGQVLNAVVPAGARDRSGTRERTFLEPVAQEEAPQPPPKLSPRQAVALELLRGLGRPADMAEIAKLAGCGLAPVAALVEKGLARRVQRRVEQ